MRLEDLLSDWDKPRTKVLYVPQVQQVLEIHILLRIALGVKAPGSRHPGTRTGTVYIEWPEPACAGLSVGSVRHVYTDANATERAMCIRTGPIPRITPCVLLYWGLPINGRQEAATSTASASSTSRTAIVNSNHQVVYYIDTTIQCASSRYHNYNISTQTTPQP